MTIAKNSGENYNIIGFIVAAKSASIARLKPLK
jgi:hypothetical protein